jgi:hypothetical protein
MNQMRRYAQQGGLPPLVAGQALGPSSGGNNANQNYKYDQYRPSKLRSLNNKHYVGMGQNNGLSGERIRLNQHHNSQEKLSSYSGNYGSPLPDHRGNP